MFKVFQCEKLVFDLKNYKDKKPKQYNPNQKPKHKVIKNYSNEK